MGKKAEEIINRLDDFFKGERASRLNNIITYTNGGVINLTKVHEYAKELLLEANNSYIYGNNHSVIILSAMSIEAALRDVLKNNRKFYPNIESAFDKEIIDQQEKDFLHKLRKIRNGLVHSDTKQTIKLAEEIGYVINVNNENNEAVQIRDSIKRDLMINDTDLPFNVYTKTIEIILKIYPL